jgi:hypothetical protein
MPQGSPRMSSWLAQSLCRFKATRMVGESLMSRPSADFLVLIFLADFQIPFVLYEWDFLGEDEPPA